MSRKPGRRGSLRSSTGMVPARAVARALGVGLELIEGLVSQHKIEGVVMAGRCGQAITLVAPSEIERLKGMIT